MFLQLGDDRYTCVAPPGFEVDPAAVTAIRQFDPGMIPIWRIQLWRFPWSPAAERVVHHGIGRYYPIPRMMKRELRIEMPADATGPAPNFLDAMFEDTDTIQYRMGGPGLYIPFGWNAYYWCRWQFDRVTADKWDAAIDRRRAQMVRQRQAWQEELDYRRRQVEPWILKKLEGVTDADWQAYAALAWGNKGLAASRRREKKAFMDLGRSPRSSQTYGRVAPV